ncbi:MAG: 6-phosphogluconolactonase [Bacteroidota bacterium]|nr:6-phosphogluconolactonase [Bacteroidota bacterium]MDP4216649.1 6-phosphogluconolactonase [Bacteroidota bacterium]MDP4245322.1 6-phosphogluconolactonase [Bacteroidota bacterium]MDP4253371.1 6-phosphogluconolactonase [Bacteroidota bacterium]
MNLHIFKNSEELSQAAASWIATAIGETLARQDRFTIALSGGSTPLRLHQLLAATPYKERIDWSRLHVFWGDERAVPFDDKRNNAKMAYDSLLNFVPVPASQIHVMRTDISPEEAATEYEAVLHQYFDSAVGGTAGARGGGSGGGTSFDLVLLGMGDDGHTLSLFPGTAVVHEERAWAKAYYLEAQQMYRITLTKTIVNYSARIAFLATGAGKAHALREVLKGPANPDLYPSQVIKPVAGELHWFVDEAAVSLLDVH